MTDVAERLTISEASLLAECETVIERGMGVFIEVGTALLSVRERRLYRETHGNFEDYCGERWGLDRSYANRLIDSARVLDVISAPIGAEITTLPATESQARELAPLLDQPEELREVWQRTVERTEGRPTAAAIRETRREREEPKPDPEPTPIPREKTQAPPPRWLDDDPDVVEQERRRRLSRAFGEDLVGVMCAVDPDPVAFVQRTWDPDANPHRNMPTVSDLFTADGLRRLSKHLDRLADHLDQTGTTLL